MKIEDIKDEDYIGLSSDGIKYKVVENKILGGFSGIRLGENEDALNMKWTKESKREYVKEFSKHRPKIKWFANEDLLNKWLNNEI